MAGDEQPASPDAPRAAVEESLRSAVLGAVQALTAWLAPLFLLFAPADFFLSPPEHATALAVLDLAQGIVFGTMYLLLRRGAIPNRAAHWAASLLVLAVLPYMAANLLLTADAVFSGGFVLWAMGIALVLLSWRWLIVCLAVGDLTWLLIVMHLPPSADLTQWGFIVVAATTIAIAAHAARLKTVRRLEGLRVEETRRREELERAYAEADQAGALRRLNVIKTDFMNHAAHELATPLTPLLLEIGILRSQASLTPQQRRSVAAIDRNLERLRALVDDLLDSAKLESGRLAMARGPVDLAKVVREAYEEYASASAEMGVGLRMAPAKDAVVAGDERRLHQVVANLLNNAVKFTPRGGTVTIGARPDGTRWVVEVQDTGMGLAPGDAAKLFQPFVQLGDPRHGGLRGSGLGLNISRGIVERHSGRIGARSDGLGRGATFWFDLPAYGA